MGSSYLPGLLAVTEFEHPDIKAWCLRCTATMLKVLRNFYVNDGERAVTLIQASEFIKQVNPGVLPEDVRVGFYFATEFSSYYSSYGSDSSSPVSAIWLKEGILDFDNIGSAWASELENRTALAERAKAAQMQFADGRNPGSDPADLDPLLRIYNRRRFEADIDGLLSAASAASPFSILVLDLDHFKQVNDTQGHAAGDIALKMVASEVSAVLAGKGFCYRYGGDEIVVLLPNYITPEAEVLAERTRAAVEVARLGVADHPITVSIGVATYPESAQERRQLFGLADETMYAAKKAGGNQVRKATPASQQSATTDEERRIEQQRE